MKRIIPILVLIVVLAVAGYYGWSYYTQQSSAGANTLGGSGTIETEQVAITPQTSGRIIAAPEEEGVPVKKGDVLYRLDPAIATLQVQQAIAGANAAAANLRNVRDDSASTQRGRRRRARAQSDQANIAVKMAKVQAGYATVTSPIDGVVSSIAAKAGVERGARQHARHHQQPRQPHGHGVRAREPDRPGQGRPVRHTARPTPSRRPITARSR